MRNQLIQIGLVATLFFMLGWWLSPDNNQQNTSENSHDHNHGSEVWTCSMHPSVRKDEPGQCPICGMDLIPLEKENKEAKMQPENEVVFSEEELKLADIETYTVVKKVPNKQLQLLGKVKPDEKQRFTQTSHIGGRIENMYVNFNGEKVVKGQKIASLYSPQAITAQKELLEARKSMASYPDLYSAALNKLKLWKFSDEQIEQLLASGKVSERVDILSDYSGYVFNKKIELGNHIMEGEPLFDVVNLSRMWIMLEAYEKDLKWLKKGVDAEFEVAAYPGKKFSGKVSYIDPFVDPTTRIVLVRIEVQNLDQQFLPDMFVTASIDLGSSLEEVVVIPANSVLWAGDKAIVYVKTNSEQNGFVAREITLGEDLGSNYIVSDGLAPGEVIASNGVFRIDASAQLEGKSSMMND